MEGQYKVLCIGVNKVPGTGFNPLKYAEKNAAAAAEYFDILNNADVTLLNGNEATKTDILNWINQCNAEPVKDLTVILFFSGHASAEKNKTNEELERCLWINGSDHTALDSHKLKTTGILNASDNPDHRLILVIDACYHLESKPPVETIFEGFKKSERITSLKPYAVISSSAVGRYLFEDPALKFGVFTHYFLKTLSGRYIFFLKKKIAFFRLLQLLDKKVRNHRFTTDTGRKVYRPMLKENGMISHFSGKNFKLPVLEPTPLIVDPGDRFFQQMAARLFHFFTRTRLRARAALFGGILGILLLLLYLVGLSMVRIHFSPPRQAVLQYDLPAPKRFSLDKLEAERVGKNYYREVSFYLFKYNWVSAFMDKLDETGKIILLGNLLGHRLSGIDEKRMIQVALKSIDDVFYWDPEDLLKLLEWIRGEYKNFDANQKWRTLELLEILGTKGIEIAQRVFDFKNETSRYARDLFLNRFYSVDFLKRNIRYFNPYDYFHLKKTGKPIPLSQDQMLQKKTDIFLRKIILDIPDSYIDVTDKTKLSAIYKNLQILASLGSPYFRKKASFIFRIAFDPDELIYMYDDCWNSADKLWVLEQYFKKVDKIVLHDEENWWRQLTNCIFDLPRIEKAGIIKVIIDNKYDQIPRSYQSNFFYTLIDAGPNIITLTDWENWLKRYRPDPKFPFYTILEMGYKDIFPFLEKHCEDFKHLFHSGVYNSLYKVNKTKTINLAEKIFDIGNGNDRLHVAVFLYNKNYPGYSGFILEFLENAWENIQYQQILQDFYGSINEALIKLFNNHIHLRQRLKRISNHPKLFYRFFPANMQLWPDETIQQFLTSEIPRGYRDGYPFMRKCEQLPGIFRKKMVFKIFKSEIEPYFRSEVEAALAKHYPEEFLQFVFDKQYQWNRYTRYHVIKAYKEFSYEALKEEVVLHLREESYLRVGFICEALLNKKGEKLNIGDIRSILSGYDRPLERIALRGLRYYVNNRRFLEVK